MIVQPLESCEVVQVRRDRRVRQSARRLARPLEGGDADQADSEMDDTETSRSGNTAGSEGRQKDMRER